MTIACLGWGSLIWKPEDLPVDGEWKSDGPLLPVEFARQSKNGSVTLVILPGSALVQTLWVPLKVPDLCEARIALCEREGTIPKHVGFWPTRDPAADEISNLIGTWVKQRKLDGVVWTALPPKWNEQNGVVPTIDQVLQHLRAQGADSRAERYVRKAPAQVRTPYRARIESELGWTAQE